MLFKDTANIKLEESVPKGQNRQSLYLFSGYDMFGGEKDPYPKKEKLDTMGQLCQ